MKRSQKCIKRIYLWKVQKLFHFFWLFNSWNHQRIFEKYSFWKYNSWFPSEVSKLTPVRYKANSSFKYWFLEAKYVIWICYGPKEWLKHDVDTIQTKFCKNDGYYRAILVNNNFFHAWKCIISGLFYRSEFCHLRRKSAVLFSKWQFGQFFFGGFMNHKSK